MKVDVWIDGNHCLQNDKTITVAQLIALLREVPAHYEIGISTSEAGRFALENKVVIKHAEQLILL